VAGRARIPLDDVSRRVPPSADRVSHLYAAFTADLPALAAQQFDPAVIPYVDFERIVVEWLLQAAAQV